MNWIESDNASARARARAKCDREEAKRTSLSVSSRMSVFFFVMLCIGLSSVLVAFSCIFRNREWRLFYLSEWCVTTYALGMPYGPLSVSRIKVPLSIISTYATDLPYMVPRSGLVIVRAL